MQKLSLRKYAVIIGVSHTAVAKAVKSGYIAKGWDAETKKIIVNIANEEWGNEAKERNLQGVNDTGTNTPLNTSIDTAHTEMYAVPISENTTIAEARRRKEIYNAELARMAALKEQGLYVEKEKVYNALFEFGKQVRLAFQSIPDRVIDTVLAAKNRTEAHGILLEAINKTLEQLTKPPTLS